MKKTSIVLMTLTALLMPLPLLAQSVRELIPPSAPAGARVMVSGRGLADPSIAVAFGSVSASVVERNDRYIEVVVPSAATTGNVRVTLGATLIKELPFTLANAPAYTVTTLAGGPPSKNVVLKHPWAATVILPDGIVAVADEQHNQVKLITPAGVVSVLAGAERQGFKDGKGAAAEFKALRGITFDAQRRVLYVSDNGNSAIREVALDGTVKTLAGDGKQGFKDGTGTGAQFKSPYALTVGADGAIYVADSMNHRIRRVTTAGVVTTFAGAGGKGNKDGALLAATFNEPRGLVAHGADFYVADTKNNLIRKISGGQVTTLAVGKSSDGLDEDHRSLRGPSGIGVDEAGDLIVADSDNDVIRKIVMSVTPPALTTLAGSGRNGWQDGAPASAQFKDAVGIAVAGAIYVADEDNDAIRRLCAAVTVTGLFSPTGAVSQGTEVRVFGTGFVPGGTTVKFNDVAATDVRWISASELAVKLPQIITGGSVSVVVSACGGTTDPTSFIVDNTPPVLTITNNDAPLPDGSMFKVPVTPKLTATDDIDPAPRVTATLNGLPFTSGTTISADGVYTLIGVAEDAAGNRHEVTVHFTIDATPPVVTVLEGTTPFPADFFFNRPVVIDLVITDLTTATPDARIDNVTYTLKSPYTFEGTHAFTARVTDALGNFTDVGPLAFTIDTTPPSFTFTSHTNKQVVTSRELTLVGGSDDALAVKVNGIDATVDTTAKTFTISLSLLEGKNTFTVSGTDRAGNSGSAAIELVLDTRAPELTIADTASCTRAESLELRGTVSDPNIDKVVVKLGDATTNATVTSGNWTATIALGAEGRKAILVEASDSSGHVATEQVTLSVDRTNPSIEISEGGASFTATITGRAVSLFLRATDADVNTTLTATLDGAAYASGTQIASEGSHTLRVTAKDCAGNEATREHAFTIDLTAPRFLTFNPASGSKVSQIPGSLSGTVDTDAVEVRVLERNLTAPATNGAFTIGNVAFADGINELTLEVVDRAGHTGRASYTLGIKTTKPVVEIVEGGAAMVDGTVYTRAVTPHVRVYEQNVTATATLDGAPFTTGTEVSADGAHTIVATANDSVYGQSNTVTRRFTIDRSGPPVVIVSPADGATTDAGTIDVRVTAADAVSVSVNGIAALKEADGSWLTRGLPLDLGENLLVAHGRDAAGNTGSDTVTLTRGAGGPAIVLTFPPDNYVTNRPRVDVVGRVLRPNSTVAVTVPPASGVSAAVDPAGVFRLTGASLEEGEWTITAIATEGGKSTSVSARVIADFTPPRVKILEGGEPLEDGAGFATQAVLSGEATDRNQSIDYTLSIDGSAVTAPVTITAAGGHTVVITARDAAGNESRLERTFFIGTSSAGGCRLEAFDPPDQSIITSQQVQLAGRCGGAAGVKVNGVPAQVANGSFCATVELPQEGANDVTIVCTNTAGEPMGDPVTITLNRVTNEPSITITTPAEDHVTQTDTIDVTGTLGNGAISVHVNGKQATINGSTWTATGVRLLDGINVLVARAKNNAGRAAIASRRVTFLKDAPSIAISTPVPGFITGSNTTDVSGTWSNLEASSMAVDGLAGAIEVTSWSETTGKFIARNVPLQSGDNTIAITGRDRVGRLARAEIVVRYQTGLPVITITDPADNTYFPASQGDTFRVSGTFNAADGSSVEVNGISASVDGAAKTFFADVPLSTLPGGMTPVVARLAQPGGDDSGFDSVRVFRLSEAPKVLETFPAKDAIEVDPGSVILVLFSAPMERSTMTGAFRLENASGTAVNGITWLDKDVLTFAPATPLTPGERYTIKVSSDAKDLAGQSLASAIANSFVISTTAPAQAPSLTTASGRICAQFIDVTGTSAPGARVRIDYRQIVFTTTASATGAFSYKIPLSGEQGFHVIRVRTLGADGTLSAAAEICVEVDCAGPRVLSAKYDRTNNQLAIVFSTEMKAATLTTGATGSIQLVMPDDRVVGGTINASGANVTVTPAESLTDKTFTLKITRDVEDTQGRRLELPFTQLFAIAGEEELPPGYGFITGEVYDATTGRPLAGADITIEAPTAAFARTPRTNANITTHAVTIHTDARGRYVKSFPEGAHTIRASANGYTTAWRQIIVPAGAGVIPIDIRLTRAGETKSVSSGATTLTHGGDNAVTRRAELTIPAGAVTSGTNVTLTSTGAQSLAGLLPLGWSPLASAVILSEAKDLPSATLSFDVPQSEITAASQTLTAVRYDESRDEWRVVTPVVNVANDKATFDATTAGAYALVYADRRSGLSAPAEPNAGAPLIGVADACAAGTCPPMVATSFPLNPDVVLPTGSTVATLNIEGGTDHIFPSGTAVQAYIDEELRLADGGRELDPPFATDLLLYRDLAGNKAIATFNLAPSPRAAEVFLEVGFDHIRILPYPGRLDRGTLVGPEGGRVPADDKVAVEIPTGATSVELHATASSLADPGSFGPIAGYTIVGGLQLTLQRAGEAGPVDLDGDGEIDPVIGVELSRPARATFTIDSPHTQLILVELLDQTPFGNRVFRLASEMTAIDASRWTTKAIDRNLLPIDGIVREGRYLLLAPSAPIAFAKGIVRNGAGGPAAANARVTTPGLGVADLTRLTGIFNIPVPATPAAPFTLVPRTLALGDGAAYQHASAPAPDAVVDVGDLVMIAQPPAVVSTLPANNATEVGLGANVQITFSKDIDPASAGVSVSDATGSVTVAGSVVTWKLPPGEFLKPNQRYTVVVSSTTRALNGASIGQPYVFTFTTVTRLASTEVHPEKIRITIPDAAGNSKVIGDAGALPAGWNAVPVRRNRDFSTRYQAQAAADGSFTVQMAGVSLSDTIDLRVINNAGAMAAIIPLTPFVSEDGRGFVVPVSKEDVRFISVDGVEITVPAGAFAKPTAITVTPSTRAVYNDVPNFDNELTFHAGVNIQFDGKAKKPLEIDIPAPANLPPDAQYTLGWLGQSIRGPRVMIIDTLRIENGKFTTRPGVQQANLATPITRVRTNEVLVGKDAKKYLIRLARAGQIAAVSFDDPVTWLFFETFDLVYNYIDFFNSQFLALYAADFYVIESGGIVMPGLANKPFTVSGIDSSTGMEVFSRTYSELTIGGPGDIVLIDNPNPDLHGPLPVFATPFRIEAIDLISADSRIPNFRFQQSGTSVTITPTIVGASEPARLPEGTTVQVLNATTGLLSATRTADDTGYFTDLDHTASRGDQLVLFVSAVDVHPDTEIAVVFNEAIQLPTDSGGTDEDDQEFLRANIRLLHMVGGTPLDLGEHIEYSIESGARRIVLGLGANLVRGGEYQLVLTGALTDLAGKPLGATPALPTGSGEIVLPLKVRQPHGEPWAFELEPASVHPSAGLRDLAQYGNIAFVSALDGGLLAYYLDDPAALQTSAAGVQPKPFAFVPGRWSDPSTGAGITMGFDQHWAVATDHHGRVFSTGIMSDFAVLRTYRVEDFVKAGDITQCPGFPSAPTHSLCTFKGAVIVGWRPGSSSNTSAASGVLISDRPEALPRKVQILVQDDEEVYESRTDFEAAYASVITSVTSYPNEGFKKFDVNFTYMPGAAPYYLTQRVTVINESLRMRWSADVRANAGIQAVAGVIARPTDKIRVLRNLRTYALVSLFGFGVALHDLNAVESNDAPNRPADYEVFREQIMLTKGERDATSSGSPVTALTFSPDAAVMPGTDATGVPAYALDPTRGLVGMSFSLPDGTTGAGYERGYGLIFKDRASGYTHPRLAKVDQVFSGAGRTPLARFSSVGYHGNDDGDYLVVAGGDYGLLVASANAGSTINVHLDETSLVDMIWIPSGAWSVRVIPNSTLAVVVDGKQRVLLVDLGRIDESDLVSTANELFPTALAALTGTGAGGDIGADDPRILWKSAPNLISGTLPPLVDPRTGTIFGGSVLTKQMLSLVAADPQVRMLVDLGSPDGRMSEIDGPTPLGVAPSNDLAPILAANPNASLAAFRLEVTLPAGLGKALEAAGETLALAVESEIAVGAESEQTPAALPRAHLRKLTRGGATEDRPAEVKLERVMPRAATAFEQAELEKALRGQDGASTYLSPWIVAVAEPRASERTSYAASLPADCKYCKRPDRLMGESESDGVFELWTGGRYIAVRPAGSLADNIFDSTSYKYLGERGRLAARFPTIMADVVRPPAVRVPAHNPPVAAGLLEETTYVHSGEVEASDTDLHVEGRAGMDVVITRTYRSRTLGGGALGQNWDSSIFRRLRALPNGDVEYHDGAGEIWVYERSSSLDAASDAEASAGAIARYVAPPGLFLNLVRTERGFTMFDAKWRITTFDALGRIISESDEFYDATVSGTGNTIRYVYDDRGRVAEIIDPNQRSVYLKYWTEADVAASEPGAYVALLRQIQDWRGRTVNYEYDGNGRLVRVKLPEFNNTAASSYAGTGGDRPVIEYTYETVTAPASDDVTAVTNFLDFFGNLTSIKDPAQVALPGTGKPRVRFTYDMSDTTLKRDRVIAQTWPCGTNASACTEIDATFTYDNPAKTTVKDILGQDRIYDLTSPTAYDKRVHIDKMTVVDVPVIKDAETALPATASATAPDIDENEDLVTDYEYTSHGQLDIVTSPSGLQTDHDYTDLTNGAPGTRLDLVKETGSGLSIVTKYEYDTAANAVGTVVSVGRGTSPTGPFVTREAGAPSRDRLTVSRQDEGVKTSDTFDELGQLKTSETTGTGGGSTPAPVTNTTTITYYNDSATPKIARGKPETITEGPVGSSGPASAPVFYRFTYSEPDSFASEREEVKDEKRDITTTVDRDSYGRVVQQIVKAVATGAILADERFGYDASGNLVYSARVQKDVGLVETFHEYDSQNRRIETRTTKNVVDGAWPPVDLTTRTSHNLGATPKSITVTDPFTGTAPSGAVTKTELDGLGRVSWIIRDGGSPDLTETQRFAYDIHGELAYESDNVRVALLSQHDAAGREIGSVMSDGTQTKQTWSVWDELLEQTDLSASSAIVAKRKNHYTEKGRLRRTAEEIDTDRYRVTRYTWDDGEKNLTTRIGATAAIDADFAPLDRVRVEQIVRDGAGRVEQRLLGEAAGPDALLSPGETFLKTVTTFDGEWPVNETIAEPRAAMEYATTRYFDSLGRVTLEITGGTLETKTEYDEANNVVLRDEPGLNAVTSKYDARGLPFEQTLPDGRVIQQKFDARGNLRVYVDEVGTITESFVDGLGRVTVTKYPDPNPPYFTEEHTKYEPGSGLVSARRNRAGQWLSFKYDAGGRIASVHLGEIPNTANEEERYSYDGAGRLIRVADKDSAVEFDDFDSVGRPRITRAIRYASGSGLTGSPIVFDAHTQGHRWSVYDEERSRWRMPVAGSSLPSSEPATPWRSWIDETYDGGGNVVAQREEFSAIAPPSGAPFYEAIGRGVGRLVQRKRVLGGSSDEFTTFFGYNEGTLSGAPTVPVVPPVPGKPTGLLGRAETQVGTATRAGSQVTRDDGLRVETAKDLGLASRISSFAYTDNRGRLTSAVLHRAAGASIGPAANPKFNFADFVQERAIQGRLSSSEISTLGAAAKDVLPLTWSLSPSNAWMIGEKNNYAEPPDPTAVPPVPPLSTQTFAYVGGRRESDEIWETRYDERGRMVSTWSDAAGRRIDYAYDPLGHIVGRTAYQSAGAGAWSLETRTNVLARDGLPADTTFVWDPIVERLVAVYEAGASTTATSTETGLLRQYLHGDQAMDDPIEVILKHSDGSVRRYLPVVDEAATGSLQAVFGDDGDLLERVLYADAFGDAPRYLSGPVVDRIAAAVVSGKRELRIRLIEEVLDSTLAAGTRLTALDASGDVLASRAPTRIDNGGTIVWEFTTSEWSGFVGGAANVEIAVTDALRAEGWGSAWVSKPPPFATTLFGVTSDDARGLRVVITETVSNLETSFTSTAASQPDGSPLYELRDLYLAGSSESETKLLFDFHALPFREPANSLVFARARWYDPATANFLTPDPLGYIDSSDLYTFAAGDPVNNRDPLGLSVAGQILEEVVEAVGKKAGEISDVVKRRTGKARRTSKKGTGKGSKHADEIGAKSDEAGNVIRRATGAVDPDNALSKVHELGDAAPSSTAGKSSRIKKVATQADELASAAEDTSKATNAADGITLRVKFVKGMDEIEFTRKVNRLKASIEKNQVFSNIPHGVSDAARRRATSAYRKKVTARINTLYKNNPVARDNALRKLRSSDIDHIRDLQIGGTNASRNFKSLHSFTNQELGRQISRQLPRGVPTRIVRIIVE